MRSHRLPATSTDLANHVGIALLVAFLGLCGHRLHADERLTSIYQVVGADGEASYQQLIGSSHPSTQTKRAFRAIVSHRWPPDLVPIYRFKRRGQLTYARFPPTGQEAISTPFFFALPLLTESTERKLLGRWACIATHSDGAKEYFAWDLTAQGHEVAGRFDVDTDFRFASIVEGSFRDGQIELKVKYIEANYRLWGRFMGSKLKGEWIRQGESRERGDWEAERDDPLLQLAERGVDLWVCRREGRSPRLVVEGETIEEGWERDSLPLCRVWR